MGRRIFCRIVHSPEAGHVSTSKQTESTTKGNQLVVWNSSNASSARLVYGHDELINRPSRPNGSREFLEQYPRVIVMDLPLYVL